MVDACFPSVQRLGDWNLSWTGEFLSSTKQMGQLELLFLKRRLTFVQLISLERKKATHTNIISVRGSRVLMTNCRFREHKKNAHLIKGFLSVCIFRKLVDYWIFFSFNMFCWLNSPVAYHPYLSVLAKPHFSQVFSVVFLFPYFSVGFPIARSTCLFIHCSLTL